MVSMTTPPVGQKNCPPLLADRESTVRQAMAQSFLMATDATRRVRPLDPGQDPSGSGVRHPRLAAQSPLARFLSDAPLADRTCVGRKPLGSPLRECLERLNHLWSNPGILKASVQVGEVTGLAPARHRHHMSVPDHDDDLEGRADHLVRLIRVNLADERLTEVDDRLGDLANCRQWHT